MKEIKKYLVYYNEESEIIGVREHHFDWEEGDEIMTNGRMTTVFGIFDGTSKNIRLCKEMFHTLRLHQPKKKVVRVLDEGFVKTGDPFEDMMNALIHSHDEVVDVKRKVWKSFDAQLDFVDSVFSQMEA